MVLKTLVKLDGYIFVYAKIELLAFKRKLRNNNIPYDCDNEYFRPNKQSSLYAIDRERRLENKILNTKGIFCIKYGQELNCRRVRKDT